MKTLYLVDVSSMFFRAFYAIPRLTNDKGMPTNALYGVLSMTLKLLREEKPDYIAFCFDRKEPSFRSEIYPEYKANRTEMPEDLVAQIPHLRSLVDVLGIKALDAEGFEADDIIGTYTKFGRDHELDVVIVSGDKDFAQLIAPHVVMYDTMKDVRYDDAGVRAKWGVRPDQMIDYLSLTGDSSDNIPGVRGIGPKGAQKLLKDFDSLDGVYRELAQISGKSLVAKLTAERDSAYLSRQLVTIRQDVPLACQLEELHLMPLNLAAVAELAKELGFKTLLKSLQAGEAKSAPQTEGTLAPPTSAAASDQDKPAPSLRRHSALAQIEFSEFIAQLKPYSEVHLLDTGRGLFVGHRKNIAQVPIPEAASASVFFGNHIRFIGFDLKDTWKLLNLKDPVAAYDVCLAAYIARGREITDFQSTYQTLTDKKIPDLATPIEIFQCFYELEKIVRAQLEEVGGQKVLTDIELPATSALYDMEQTGILIAKDVLAAQSRDLQGDLARLEKEIFALAGGEFNIGSPKQLANILFEKLKLPAGKKTKTGRSTDSDVLEKLKDQHPIARLLIDYRELAKLKSTYVDSLPNLIQASTGRIHTHYRQAVTSTGRLSSVNPNLQNIPIRTERGRAIRKAFVAPPGSVLISADYSQIELRILAHISDDPGLLRAFQEDLDIHAATASEIFNKPLSDVDANDRRAAKAVNFGIAYGQGAFGLAETLGVSRSEATEIINRYFTKFRMVREYMNESIKRGYEHGYVETLFGRRRYLNELKNKNQGVRAFGERIAINSPIQGTASDLAKMAMNQLYLNLSIPILLQVHDEFVFECPLERESEETLIIRKTMESVYPLKVPLKVNVASGPNWEDAHS
jgi:DNA polymerase-1